MFWVEDVLNSAKGLMLNRSVRKMSLVAQSILHHQNLLPIIGQNRDLLITDSQTRTAELYCKSKDTFQLYAPETTAKALQIRANRMGFARHIDLGHLYHRPPNCSKFKMY